MSIANLTCPYQTEKTDIIVNILNRNADTIPSAFTDSLFSRAQLGQILLNLENAGHAVFSVSYNGNVADVVCGCNSDEWTECLRR